MTRLDAPFGARLDRSTRYTFTFEGETLQGYAGDTIASALAANGRWMLSRSFKYHRPRGGFSFAGAEANTLVQVGPDPNVAADLTPLAAGMQITAQNVNGTLARDRDAVLDHFARFLPVGFYYRTFMGPTQNAWLKFWEPLIRKKAGLGVIPTDAPFRQTDKLTQHCDIAIIGGGAAGLAAADVAAQQGADVVLVDDQPQLGGALTYSATPVVPNPPRGVRVLHAAICTGLFEDNWLAILQGDTLIRLRAGQVILATGTIDQPAVFRNNDLPGIFSGGAVRRLIHHFGVKPGTKVAVLAAGGASDTLASLKAAQVDVVATVKSVTQAHGKRHICAITAEGRTIPCDALVIEAGSIPSWHLPCQSGARFSFDPEARQFTFTDLPDTVHLAGSLAGHADATASGHAAAQCALGKRDVYRGAAIVSAFDLPLAPHPKGKDFIDFDEDLQIKDIQNAVKEGYRDLELVKRFTTVGMGPSQGRHSALHTARIVAAQTDRSVADIGVTTARPPTAPETLGALAGPGHTAERRTALHHHHIAAGAHMRPVGAWWRPYLYGTGDRDTLIANEVAAVRECVGVLDVSTLGTLEVRGPDAGAFLDRIYTMAHASQPIGRVRYCLMLNEAGTVIDDGVAYRLAEDRFYVTATTGAVGRVYSDMAFWNAQWRMNVDVVNLTSAFSGLNITGPNARALVDALESTIDFGKDAFPYLSGRSGTVADVPVHAMRIGFTGELSFELHCPSSHAARLWTAVQTAGEAHGLRPYGLEASRILRLEKGHILIGQDTDALSTPDELGLGWAVSKKKPFFVGKRSIEMRARLGVTRRLAAVEFAPDADDLPSESCLVMAHGAPVGHVTSVVQSPTLGRTIALAYVAAGDVTPGARISIKARSGAMVQGTVVEHAFFDPANERQDI